ncbi:MAG: nickel pincer cofactor biosynthesis protein LarC [Verrucomicrobiota bacterium]|nr:nickel pincer cofactor biosynthesis protein LarC [Verrucomicrobiota bacterium]
MKVLFLDCFSGISGDMVLGALADLGVKPSTFEWELTKLGIGDFHMHFDRKSKSGISGIKFGVHEGKVHRHSQSEPAQAHSHGHTHTDHTHAHEHGHGTHTHDGHECAGHHGHDHDHTHDHEESDDHGAHKHEAHECAEHHQHEEHDPGHGDSRGFKEIKALLEKSDLSAFVKMHALSIFRRIAVAEGKIHGVSPEEVHFHEVGGLDSIIDVVGACVGLETLKIEKVYFSHLQEGSGFLECAHGRFPVPAPATLEILKGITLAPAGEKVELITPTGAAIAAEFGVSFGAMPTLRIERIGYGLGTRDLASRPNVLRAIMGEMESVESESGLETDIISVIQTNIDDVSPEVLGNLMEQAMDAGALDVQFVSVQMKKNRPGVQLTLLVAPERVDEFSMLVMKSTGSFGVRVYQATRRKLSREIVKIQTEFGLIDVKVGKVGKEIVAFSPEYESCRRAAEKAGVPVKRVFDQVQKQRPG